LLLCERESKMLVMRERERESKRGQFMTMLHNVSLLLAQSKHCDVGNDTVPVVLFQT
jgi:hypothetical protein